MSHAAATQDLEKARPEDPIKVDVVSADGSSAGDNAGAGKEAGVMGLFHRINNRIEGLAGFEARGITRVAPDERQPASVVRPPPPPHPSKPPLT